jgi:hypothetical protein
MRVLCIHMDMVVAYRGVAAPTGRCKWPGRLHISWWIYEYDGTGNKVFSYDMHSRYFNITLCLLIYLYQIKWEKSYVFNLPFM